MRPTNRCSERAPRLSVVVGCFGMALIADLSRWAAWEHLMRSHV